METKWNPIVNGDLKGVPRDTRLLITRIEGGRLYVDFGYLESILERYAVIEVGDIGILVKSKECVAWMKLPEPYNPKDCNRCVHWKEWIDEFGDSCAECELIENPPCKVSM